MVRRILGGLVLGAGLAVSPAAAAEEASAVTIVVDCGSFARPEEAAFAEAQVNWLDADVSDDTVCTQCFAAFELQRYLRALTKTADGFALVDDDTEPAALRGDLLLVGGPASNRIARQLASPLELEAPDPAGLGPQGYRIVTKTVDGRSVTVVAGGGRVGTLYGAYDLLHRMGVRWFGPEDFHEEVPSAIWDPAFDVTEKPDFLTRGFYFYEDRAGPEFWLWMARNRLNEGYSFDGDQPLMHKLGIRLSCGSHTAQFLFLGPQSEYPYDHPSFRGDETRPADPYPVSAMYAGDADGDGRLSNFEAHPEWYPLVDGRRVPGIQEYTGVNFCTSNPHACEEFTRRYVDALVDGRYRGAEIVNFWTLDGGGWCRCPDCTALGTPTDRNLLLVHAMARQVKRAAAEGRLNHPVELRFLAYADVREPPTRPLPADFDYDMCAATFYPITRCYVHRFDDPACGRNASLLASYAGWAVHPDRHYRGRIVIGEYYNVSRFKSLPVCFMSTMAADIPYYFRTGARFFQYMHVTTGRWGSKALTNWQMARQTWDADTDCEALWADYFSRRYGPASGVMREFYENLERMLANVEPLKGWSNNLADRLNTGAAELFNEPHLRMRREPGVDADAPTLEEMVEAGRRCRTLIDRAAGMDLPLRIRTRIAEDERQFAYAERTLNYYWACARGFELARTGRPDDAAAELVEARRLADLLRQDTWSMDLSYIHVEPYELNGLTSTFAAGAVEALEKAIAGATRPAGQGN